jgi:CheY-like chemotaxis protein
MTEKTMSASQRGGPQDLDRPENPSNSAGASARETQVRFEDVDSPFQVILFADDEPETLQARWFLLRALGFSVLTADSGERLLDLLRDGAIDAAVLDYLMPGMDGRQTAPEIREVGGNTPIILSSRCFSSPQSVLGLVNASLDKLAGSKALLEMLEQQLHALIHGDQTLTN